MTSKEALKLFDFQEYYTEESLRKKYLELSKKFHPDINNSQDAEEIMKKINCAYDILKTKCTSSDVISYYNTLKERLYVFKSKTIYLPNTLEYKYAKLIDELLGEFTFSADRAVVRSAFDHSLKLITDFFADYKNEVCKNIPDFFLKKFYNLDELCPFDEYALKVNKVVNGYNKIDGALNETLETTLTGLAKKVDTKLLEKLYELKEEIIKNIADKKINLEDGKNKYHDLIIEKLKKEEALEKALQEAYIAIISNFNNRMMELKPDNNEEIYVAMHVLEDALKRLKFVSSGVLAKEELPKLSALSFKDINELSKKEGRYEIYISRDSNTEPEFVLKQKEDEKYVYFIKKIKNKLNEETVETYFIGKNGFYEKYMRFTDFLDKATFINRSCSTGKYMHSIILYRFYGILVYITKNGQGSIKVGNENEIGSLAFDHYALLNGKKYQEPKVIIEEIYNSFLKLINPLYNYKEKEETIKRTREKSEKN